MDDLGNARADFEKRLNQCWHSVLAGDVLQLGARSDWPGLSRDVRAGAVVMTMGELEHLINQGVNWLNRQVESVGPLVSEVRPGVRALHFDVAFTSAAGSRDDAHWTRRLEILDGERQRVRVALPSLGGRAPLVPVGGRTPRVETLRRLWDLYGLPGAPFPQLSWRQSIESLANLRNDIAHRNVSLRDALAGREGTADRVAAKIDDVKQIGLHFVDSIEWYVKDRMYLAPAGTPPINPSGVL